MDTLTVSIVVPVYSGERFLEGLADRIAEVHDTWKADDTPLELLEVIFVDDASKDDSATVLEGIADRHPWAKVITLSRNFGQHPATIAGILYSSGNWVVTLDEDLQHPPASITDLLRTVARTGSDIVYANPSRPVHGASWRDLSSRLVKKLVGSVTRNPMVEHFNSFRLVRGSVARAACSVCGHETYLDVALSWFSQRYATVSMALQDDRHVRTGKSGYSFRSLLSHSRRLIVSSQAKVLRLGAVLGFVTLLVAVVLAAQLVFSYSLDPETVNVRGWRSLFGAILFFGGISTLLIGALIEYATTIVLHVQGKPTFFVIDRSSDRILREHFGAAD